MDDTEIRIPTNTNDVSAPNNNTPDTISDSKSVLAYPADWMNSFGNNYYTQSQAPELTEFTVDKNWQTAPREVCKTMKKNIDTIQSRLCRRWARSC